MKKCGAVKEVVQAVKYIRKKILAMLAMTAILCSFAGFAAYGNEEDPSAFTKEEIQLINEKRTWKVGYVCDRKPISFQGEDGELAGTTRYLLDRIAETGGLQFDYVPLPAGEITYDYLLKNGFDLVTSVEYNKENQNARGILMSDPYLSSRKVIVAREGLKFKSDGHFTVAISTGSQTIRKVISAQFPNFKLVDYPDMESCLDAVNRGDADLIIQNQYVVEYWLYKPIYHDLIVIPMLEMEDQLCCSAVVPLEETAGPAEQWQEKETLISIINKSIRQIPDGEVAGDIIASTAENMYEFTLGDFLYQYRYMMIVLAVALVLMGILVFVAIRSRIRSINARADAKAKGEFLSTMSHEIRTPLNGLISLNYLMSQNVDDREKITNYLRQSSTVSQYLLSLVNNVLDMSKFQEGEVELEQKPVDIGLLLATVESVEKAGMEAKHIDFRTDTELSCPVIMGDAVRIQQVVINLLDNARKYVEQGGSVQLKVRQSRQDSGRIRTEIQVSDNGCGISEEFQKKIFSPFTQERNTVSKGNQGTGLGLAICALLAERMDGSMSVKSKPGKGSCFTFVFSSEPVSDQTKENSLSESAGASRSPEKSARVLIAEDNELNGQILKELLEGEGYQVSLVENGREALETFQASAPGEYGVILMDLMMPEMNGFDAARAIRALNRDDASSVRIFASTANTLPEDREKAFASGMNDFIAKPIDMRELISKLR